MAGDVTKSKDGIPALGGRESAALGVSYSLNRRLTGRVVVGAERGDGRALTALRKSDNYSLDVGGAYSLTRNIALTGGVRYRIDRDKVYGPQGRSPRQPGGLRRHRLQVLIRRHCPAP